MAEKKAVTKKKTSSKKWNAYKDGKQEKRNCPKCGPGVYLAEHKNRITCGKCNYTEMK